MDKRNSVRLNWDKSREGMLEKSQPLFVVLSFFFVYSEREGGGVMEL